jgi:hypothetical protein
MARGAEGTWVQSLVKLCTGKVKLLWAEARKMASLTRCITRYCLVIEMTQQSNVYGVVESLHLTFYVNDIVTLNKKPPDIQSRGVFPFTYHLCSLW